MSSPATAQCGPCSADPACTSSDGFPAICPESLPAAVVGVAYEATITFFLPAEVVDPGSGVTATLNSVTITSITGVPLGLSVELDDDDSVYLPANGQTSGCAAICGVALLPGEYSMLISISAVASAFGIEQVVNDAFEYLIIVEPGEGGSATFTYSPPSGCDSLVCDFSANLVGSSSQVNQYTWDFGNGLSSDEADVFGVAFDTVGNYHVTLHTVISDHLLTEVVLNSTAGGGWDDGFYSAPDPYFVLSDAGGGNVYVSGVVDESYSASWGNLNVPLTNPPYTISFYDDDFFPEDDFLGSMSFVPTGAATLAINASPSYGTASIALQAAVDVWDTANVVVHGAPGVELAWLNGDSLWCPTEGIIWYEWHWGDSLLAAGSDSVFAPIDNGWYTVTGTSEVGCNGTSDSLLYCAPNAMFVLNLSLGEWPEVVAADISVDVSAWDFVWTFNGWASDTLQGMSSWATDASGWYSAQAWDPHHCPWHSDSVLVCWPLNPPLIEDDGEGALAVTPPYALYQWWLNGEPIPGATDSVFQPTGPGIYAVSATDFADCPGVISDDWVVVGVSEFESSAGSEHWMVYPNPATDQLTFDFPVHEELYTVYIFRQDGTPVDAITQSHGKQLGVAHWTSGVYVFQAQAHSTGKWLEALQVIKR